ncbi:STAS domain-containing protein [Streptomyces sp. Q6]|uniref:STAS domain-containing protein n=1 Tax=Streptomyces citrinus TaxID=3118173 RepID=A0ACD5A4R2_9ACTN
MSVYAALNITTAGASDGVLTVRIAGALDYDTSTHLTDYVGRALDEHHEVRVLRLDCAGLECIDSMGLSVLLGLRRRLDLAGGGLRLVGRPLRLDRMLTVTGTFEHLVGDAESSVPEEASAGDAEASHDGNAHAVTDGSSQPR